MIKIDMWYNDKKEQATGLDIWFNDLGCFYSGNITIFKSSRRKFLLMRNFRPLTPPCVPFGTRRFNQLNM